MDSTVGAGTTVTMLLPRSLEAPIVAPVHADAAESVETRPDPDRRGHLLLVEDDHEVAALTRELLTSLGFSVIHVSSAEAALGALANSRDIDAVLSDVMMPGGVSGLELAREIRRRHPALTILLTTGYVEIGRRHERRGVQSPAQALHRRVARQSARHRARVQEKPPEEVASVASAEYC